nr:MULTISPECIES: universal stress protein [Micrococcaceae]
MSGHKLLRKAEEAQAADTAAAVSTAEPSSEAPADVVAIADRRIIPVEHAATAILPEGLEGAVVAAIDSTEAADRIVDKALRVAAAAKLRVDVVHVLESVIVSDVAVDGEDLATASAAVRTQLDRLAAAGVGAAGYVLGTEQGHPENHAGAGRAVAEYANRIQARSLVIGAPTHGGLSALMDASASQEIWRSARTDVTIVNPQAAAPVGP